MSPVHPKLVAYICSTLTEVLCNKLCLCTKVKRPQLLHTKHKFIVIVKGRLVHNCVSLCGACFTHPTVYRDLEAMITQFNVYFSTSRLVVPCDLLKALNVFLSLNANIHLLPQTTLTHLTVLYAVSKLKYDCYSAQIII